MVCSMDGCASQRCSINQICHFLWCLYFRVSLSWTLVSRGICEVSNSIVILYAGSKDHVKEQGEILEGIVARIVSQESSKHMEKVLNDFPPPPMDGGTMFHSFVFLFFFGDYRSHQHGIFFLVFWVWSYFDSATMFTLEIY